MCAPMPLPQSCLLHRTREGRGKFLQSCSLLPSLSCTPLLLQDPPQLVLPLSSTEPLSMELSVVLIHNHIAMTTDDLYPIIYYSLSGLTVSLSLFATVSKRGSQTVSRAAVRGETQSIVMIADHHPSSSSLG